MEFDFKLEQSKEFGELLFARGIHKITCWNIDQMLLDARDHLPKEDAGYWKYTNMGK